MSKIKRQKLRSPVTAPAKPIVTTPDTDAEDLLQSFGLPGKQKPPEDHLADLGMSPGEIQLAGRLLARAWWLPHAENHFLDPTLVCRGWVNYPCASCQEAFTRQVQYFQKEIQPFLSKLEHLAALYTKEQWESVKQMKTTKSPEEYEVDSIRVKLKEAWRIRPKKRR